MWPFNGSWWKNRTQTVNTTPPLPVEPAFSPAQPQSSQPIPLSENQPPDPTIACLELVRTVHRDCMRQHGLPRDWLDCEVLLTPINGKPCFAVVFVVKRWSDELVQHLPAYESSFRFQLEMVSASLGQRIRTLAWRFDPDAGHTIRAMPVADHWSEAAIAQRHLNLKAQALELKLLHARSSRIDHSDMGTDFQATRPMSHH